MLPGSLEVLLELPLAAAAAAAAAATTEATEAPVNVVFKLTGPPAPEELILDGIVVPTVEAVSFSSSRIVIWSTVNTIR